MCCREEIFDIENDCWEGDDLVVKTQFAVLVLVSLSYVPELVPIQNLILYHHIWTFLLYLKDTSADNLHLSHYKQIPGVNQNQQ